MLLIQGGITMKITVTGKNIAVNDKINDAIDKKFAKIGKFFADDIQAKVLMHPEKAKVKVEATISGKGNIFRAESVAQDVFDAIDDVAEKLLKQMSKYKKKLIKKNQGKESVRFEMIPEVPEAEEETKIARTKKFTLTPMTAEEAILQMELLQHNFFVFLDAESGNVTVVYKVNDEDYGLLETEH
jgi:putative sigma-54 modulation protein